MHASRVLVLVGLIAGPAVGAELGGRVSTRDGKPLAGARIEAWTAVASAPLAATTSGADGTFLLPLDDGVEPDFVRASAAGRATAVARVEKGRSIAFGLEPGCEIEGRVVDEGSRRAIGGVTVTLRGSESWPDAARPRATTGDDGRFHVSGLAPDVYAIEASAEGWQVFTLMGVRVGLAGAARGSPELTLFPAAVVFGSIVDEHGKGLGGASVSVLSDLRDASPQELANLDAQAMLVTTKSAPDGSFRVSNVMPARAFEVSVSLPGRVPARVELNAAGTRGAGPVTIELAKGAAFSGRLLLPDGNAPYSGPATARLEYRAVETESVALEVKDGGFTGFAPPGTVALTLEIPRYRDVRRPGVTLAAGTAAELGDITLDRGRVAAGHVVSAGGGPLAGASVRFSCARSAEYETAITGADGSFEVTGLPDPGAADCEFSVDLAGYCSAGGVDRSGDAVAVTLRRIGGIAGRIVTGQPPVPQRGATVEVYPGGEATTFRDPGGRFRIPLEPGRYTVRVSLPGFVTARREAIEVRSGEDTELRDIVLARGVALSGIVLDGRTGAPVVGALVTLDSEPDPSSLREAIRTAHYGQHGVETGADGRFTLTGVGPGRHVVYAAEAGHAPAEVDVDAVPAAPDLVLRLGGLGSIAGTVRDRDGVPCPHCGVAAIDASNVASAAETDAAGAYRIEGLAPRRYTVMSMPTEEPDPSRISVTTADVVADAATVVNFPPARGEVAVSGVVTRDGRPLPARLIFMPDETAPIAVTGFALASSGADGKFSTTVRQPGRYAVEIEPETADDEEPFTAAPLHVTITDPPGGPLELIVPTAELSGRVTDAATGKPLAGAVVDALRCGPGSTCAGAGTTAQAGADGRFTLTGLERGAYELWFGADAHATRVERVTVGEGRSRDVDIALRPAQAIRLRIVDEQDDPVPSALVMYARVGARGTRATSDVDGLASLADAPDSPVDLVVLAGGFAPGFVIGATGAGAGAEPLRTVLFRGGGLVVTVTDGAGRPVEGALVHLVLAGRTDIGPLLRDTGRSSMTTAPDGTLRVTRLAPGDYEVGVTGSGGDVRRRVSMAQGVTREVTLRVP